MNRIIIGVLFLVGFASSSLAQNQVKWMTWEEALAAHKKNPKKIVVDIYTDWCTWCKKMDKATFKKDHIAKFINQNYYAVKFNCEDKKDINFNGKVYKSVVNGKKIYHELAVEITRGKLRYPTVVFLDENLQLIQAIEGFQDAKSFEMIISYFAGDHHKDTMWKTYTRTYRSKMKPIAVSN